MIQGQYITQSFIDMLLYSIDVLMLCKTKAHYISAVFSMSETLYETIIVKIPEPP